MIVTAGASGIGLKITERFLEEGVSVYICDIDKEALNDVQEKYPSLKVGICDVADRDSVARMFNEAVVGLGGLDCLVNNAGIAKMGPLAIQPLKDFEAHFSVNVFGMLRATQAFVPLLGADETRRGTPGRIVNITSVGGRIAAPYLGAYTATKHANEAMTDTLRRELVLYGIDAIAIGPGSVKTPIWEKAEKANKDGPYAKSDWASSNEKVGGGMSLGGEEGGLDPHEVCEGSREGLAEGTPEGR